MALGWYINLRQWRLYEQRECVQANCVWFSGVCPCITMRYSFRALRFYVSKSNKQLDTCVVFESLWMKKKKFLILCYIIEKKIINPLKNRCQTRVPGFLFLFLGSVFVLFCFIRKMAFLVWIFSRITNDPESVRHIFSGFTSKEGRHSVPWVRLACFLCDMVPMFNNHPILSFFLISHFKEIFISEKNK